MRDVYLGKKVDSEFPDQHAHLRSGQPGQSLHCSYRSNGYYSNYRTDKALIRLWWCVPALFSCGITDFSYFAYQYSVLSSMDVYLVPILNDFFSDFNEQGLFPTIY